MKIILETAVRRKTVVSEIGVPGALMVRHEITGTIKGRTLLGYAGVAHRFHTPGMRALRSLARSKIVSANCPGYFVTDPESLRGLL